MIVLWMVNTLLVGVLLLLAAGLLELCARALRLPQRGIWIAAVVATLGLAAASAYSITRPAASVPPSDAAGLIVPELDPTAAPSSIRILLDGAAASLRAVVEAPTSLVRPHVHAPVVRRAGVVLGVLWLAASAALAVIIGVTLGRDRRRRRAWPREVVAGERVRVAPAAGPALVGLLHPEIVVPSWLLRAPAAQQRMVVAHEASHLRARDNLPLALSGLALTLLPWHPAVWWMAARLRLAIELDCDARVIRGGAPARRYGSMLVDMAARRAALPLGGVALTETTSHLERRILAMTQTTPRRAYARAIVPAAAAVALVMAACEADLPTSAELEAMDVADVETQVAPLTGSAELEPLYVIDGVAADAAAAHALSPEEIARVEVVKQAMGEQGSAGQPRVVILTQEEARRRGLVETALRLQPLGSNAKSPDPESAANPEPASDPAPHVDAELSAAPMPDAFSGMLIIDGRRVAPSALRSLSPEAIERVEVLKGAAATGLYSEPEAANGVIRITTKAGGAP